MSQSMFLWIAVFALIVALVLIWKAKFTAACTRNCVAPPSPDHLAQVMALPVKQLKQDLSRVDYRPAAPRRAPAKGPSAPKAKKKAAPRRS